MLLFVDHIAAKQIIAPALNQSGGRPVEAVRRFARLIQGAIDCAGETRHQEAATYEKISSPSTCFAP